MCSVRGGTPNDDMPPPSNYGTTRGSPAQKQGTPYEEMESEIDESAALRRTQKLYPARKDDMPTPSNYGTTRGSPAQKQGTPYEDMESEIEHPTSQKSTRDDSITD